MIGWLLAAGIVVGAVVLYPKLHGERAAPYVPPVPPPVLPAPAQTIDPAHPFAGSPADQYASGAAGIRLPKATAKGRFSARQVAEALTLAKSYLVAADLDRDTVTGRSVEAVRALLDPLGPRPAFDADLRPPKVEGMLNWLSRFKPGETALVGTTIKVNGSTTYKLQAADELVVHMDYLVVYPVQRARSADQETTRVIVRHIFDFSTFYHRNTTRGKLWPTEWDEYASGVRCNTHDGFLHPDYPRDLTGGGGHGPVRDPYDQTQPPPNERCGRVSHV